MRGFRREAVYVEAYNAIAEALHARQGWTRLTLRYGVAIEAVEALLGLGWTPPTDVTTPQPAATPYDRQPTSDAERVRWRVRSDAPACLCTDEDVPTQLGCLTSPEVAACAVHDHNVMVAAREQAAMRETDDGGAT